MKKHFSYITILGFMAMGCQSDQTQNNEIDKTTVDTNAVNNSAQHCYNYIKNKDTATLTIINTNGKVKGQLTYEFYEKDRNQGIIEGEMHGDTLLANYTFNSEGKESVRQVAFLQKGNQFLEGYGEAIEKEGKMVFKDLKTLKFGDAVVFGEVDCD